MFSLSKLFQRVRTELRAATSTGSSQTHMNNYNDLINGIKAINGIRASTTKKKVTVKSFLPPSTVQQVIYDMEKFFVPTDSVTLPKEVHMQKFVFPTDSMTLNEKIQYASSHLKQILDERDAENRKAREAYRKAREALADLEKAALCSDKENTKESKEK